VGEPLKAQRWIARLAIGRPLATLPLTHKGDPHDEYEQRRVRSKMAFIVEQQAQFASDIQQLQESQAQTNQVVAQTAEVVGQVGEVVTRLANVTHAGFTEVNAKINALVDAQIRTDASLARTDKNVASTDESLKKLIAVVNRYLGERNGQ
jgi:ABC-type transporter Mla subunit MlaD